MWLKILGGFVTALAIFLGYVSTRDGNFNYERSGIINAPAEKIFPYVSDFKKGGLWSPYEKIDPNMKKIFSGPDGQAGSVMEFEGNSEAGSGKLELLKVAPYDYVEIKLTLTKPFYGENLIVYSLGRGTEGNTKFTWSMSGNGGFMSKLISLLIDCDKMVGAQFEEGISNLKTLVESQK